MPGQHYSSTHLGVAPMVKIECQTWDGSSRSGFDFPLGEYPAKYVGAMTGSGGARNPVRPGGEQFYKSVLNHLSFFLLRTQ